MYIKMTKNIYHTPVLVPEILEGLQVQPGGRYIDGTLGEGGHSEAILLASDPGGQVLGIDADHEAVHVAKNRLNKFRLEDSFIAVNNKFSEMRNIASELNFIPVHGVLLDLGISSLQLDYEEKGFSFKQSAPLDMRFNSDQDITASQIINTFPMERLSDIIFKYGEEPFSRRIARAIVKNRPIHTSSELAQVIVDVIKKPIRKHHPATQTFQAIRIAVNNELKELESTLSQAISVIGLGGRLAVISYHSLEDRIVKKYFKEQSSTCVCSVEIIECVCNHSPTIKIMTKKPIAPTNQEKKINTRSRSAKLRIAERI